MVAMWGVKEGGTVDVGAGVEMVEPAGGLERADVVAWGCGLCLGHSPAAAAAVVAAVADIVVGRVGIVVVAAVVVVVVAAVAAVASAVAVVASDP
ncbi:hypothetical protein Taro_035770, partial [Colocasia esculenta]|nr:hypothetical protein [Colocasia esculenta]